MDSLVALLSLVSLIGVVAWFHPVYAQVDFLTTECTDLGIFACADGNLLGAIRTVVNGFLVFISMLAIVVLVWAGTRYMTAQGEEDEAQKAKMMVIYTIAGLILIGLSAVVINFTISTFAAP
jgi:hypothetical protein